MSTAVLDRRGSAPADGSRGILPPPCPKTLADTGLNPVILAELTLKLLATSGTAIGHEIAAEIGLPFRILEPILVHLKEQKFVEVAGGDLMGPVSYRFSLTDAGRNRAREAMAACQ